MTDYEKFANAVVLHQEKIIGPFARVEADKVSGLDFSGDNLKITGDPATVLENLVKQYETLFGQASIEACKDAIRPLLKDSNVELPEILK